MRLLIRAKVAKKHRLLVHKRGQSEIRKDSLEALCYAVFEMASVANSQRKKARELARDVPVEAFPVLLPAVPAHVI